MSTTSMGRFSLAYLNDLTMFPLTSGSRPDAPALGAASAPTDSAPPIAAARPARGWRVPLIVDFVSESQAAVRCRCRRSNSTGEMLPIDECRRRRL